MKVISFNINSIRARIHQLEAIIEKHQPDIIGLQETKVDDSQFPFEDLKHLGYHIDVFGQKGHYGVATLSKVKPLEVINGFANDDTDSQRRAITTTHLIEGKEFKVFNGYFPQGESRDHPTKFPLKELFYKNLIDLKSQDNNSSFIIMGDFNISHQDIDIGIGEQNKKRWLRTGKCSFLPEEREWLETLLSKGLKDTFRKHYPDTDDIFSWFDYRSKGFDDDPKRGLRIDLVLATQDLYDVCTDSGVDYDIRAMEKPSDHAPVWSSFKF
ncbi:MAG: exodeoxyribonuclease III [Gammaproteobacteria bacterium]|nr:exodeoxyribonuclease III [Gammaproteobacteria bacterium]